MWLGWYSDSDDYDDVKVIDWSESGGYTIIE